MKLRVQLLAATVISGIVAVSAAAQALAQSDDEIARQLDQANRRIRLLENQLAGATDYPPAGADGECFARVLIPLSTEPVTETITLSEARTETIVIPASYETVTETVLIEQERVERRIIPATYRTVYDTVVVEPERVERRIIPATYRMVTDTVIVEPERVERRVIPATYRTITETVTVEPERVEQIVVPARYENYTEQVLVREAYTTWAPSAPLYQRARTDGTTGGAASPEDYARQNFVRSDLRELPTGEILCRVEIPAEYETVTRTRLVQAERVETRVIPAVTEVVTRQVIDRPEEVVEEVIAAVTSTVTRQVIDQPEHVVEEVIPAVTRQVAREVIDRPEEVVEQVVPARYETVTTQQIVSPERTEVRTIPAQYETRVRQVVVGGGNLDWREVLCEINATPEAIRLIQTALRDRGYNPGPIDGIINERTFSALEAYQRDNNLIVGQITRQVVEHLGVPYVPLTVNLYGDGVE